MRVIHAIYDEGNISFPFTFPEYAGPVAVIVVFPGAEEEVKEDPDCLCLSCGPNLGCSGSPPAGEESGRSVHVAQELPSRTQKPLLFEF